MVAPNVLHEQPISKAQMVVYNDISIVSWVPKRTTSPNKARFWARNTLFVNSGRENGLCSSAFTAVDGQKWGFIAEHVFNGFELPPRFAIFSSRRVV